MQPGYGQPPQQPPPPGYAPPQGGYGGPGPEGPYPVRLAIAYPDRELNRVTTFFRLFTVIPIAIVLAAIGGSFAVSGYANDSGTMVTSGATFGGLLVLPPLLMIVFRRKYPRWWYDWNLELSRFSMRVGAYFQLLDDTYPSTDEQQSVWLELDYPDAQRDINQIMPLVKWLLAIPHFIVLLFLGVAAFFVLIYAWFAILFTGRYPRGAFDFIVGVNRWYMRVMGYAFLMLTDRYPPFSLDPQ
jgi:hypothetical protein